MLLEKLCQLDGPSGREESVREFIISQITDCCTFHTDVIGNLIAEKKGSKTPKKKLMVAAHMDEVGFIVTFVKSDGTLKISSVGGVNAGVAIGRQVRVNGRIGVIGSKAIHNMSEDEKNKEASLDKLYVDIGAVSDEDARKYVSRGDTVTFVSEFVRFGDDRIKGKAIDDRFGCATMIDMIKGELEYDTTFAFTVQEEVGMRGGTVAAFSINPGFALVLEATTASDIPPAKDEKCVCSVGGGAVVSFMDRSTIYDRELYNIAFDTAKKIGIPCQTKTMVAGGNDSGAIHLSREGVRTLAISTPCRYLHSASCVVKQSDLTAVGDLTVAMLSKMGSMGA